LLKWQAEQLRLQQAQREQQEAIQRQQQEALQRQQQEAQIKAQQEALQRQQQEAALKQEEAMRQQQAAQLQSQQQAAEQQKALQSQQLQSQGGQNSALDILTSGFGGFGLTGSGVGGEKPGVSSAGPIGSTSTVGQVPNLGDFGTSYVSALNDSFVTTPNAGDNDRSQTYTPQNPYPTPASYPSVPSVIFDNPAVFSKLGTDCLFFIFYYAQGTYQQYLAARELKKQSWRFHKKYMTWFQRHEEPKITTDEYEQGTYVYFDYETGWCTRIKQDFRFEYSFLEDTLQ
jgi:CCR4-NOT transcription complex subunit 3